MAMSQLRAVVRISTQTAFSKPAPDALLQAEAVLEQEGALVAHLLQLQLQPQVVLYLLRRVAVPQPCSVRQVLQYRACQVPCWLAHRRAVS